MILHKSWGLLLKSQNYSPGMIRYSYRCHSIYPLSTVSEDDNGKLVLVVDHGLIVDKDLQGILPH